MPSCKLHLRNALHLKQLYLTTNPVRIEPELRLRRAIHMHSLCTVRRILKTHPLLLHNADYGAGGDGNTNLHLACLVDDIAIAQHLLDLGHEETAISINSYHQTPLHIASANGHVEIVNMLVCMGEKTAGVGKRDNRGRDAVMMAAAKGHDTVIQLLLTFAPPVPEKLLPYMMVKPFSNARPSTASSSSDPHHLQNPARVLLMNQDHDGNTALHYACMQGELMIQRTLLAAGANHEWKNCCNWKPVDFSATVSAEIYFKNLVAEHERDYVAAKQSRARFAEMHAEKETGWPMDQPPSAYHQMTDQGLGLGMPEITPLPDMTPLPPVSDVPPIPPMSRARQAALGQISPISMPMTPSMGQGGLRLVPSD